MPTAGSENDRLASYRFLLTVSGMRAGFSEVSGLGTDADLAPYRRGREDTTARKITGAPKYENITLKRGYSPDGRDLLAWWNAATNGATRRNSGTITVLDESGQPAVTWEFREGWPSKWTGPALNAKSGEIVIEEMVICVEGLSLQT